MQFDAAVHLDGAVAPSLVRAGCVFKQVFSPSVSLLIGKISIIDYLEKKPFMGGLGINSFWNIVFAAPP
jgi:hypothetical protein